MNDPRSTQGDPVHDSTVHLSEWTLEQLAEDALSTQERARALQHVAACARCAAELDAYRALFAALGELPRFAPAPGFSDAVMARIQLAPRADPVLARLQRWLPTTRRGWILLGGALLAPAIPVLALLAWVLSQPMVSPAAIRGWLELKSAALVHTATTSLMQWSTADLLRSWIGSVYATLQGVPTEMLVSATALLAVAIPLSAWSLVRLLRTPIENVTYAN